MLGIVREDDPDGCSSGYGGLNLKDDELSL